MVERLKTNAVISRIPNQRNFGVIAVFIVDTKWQKIAILDLSLQFQQSILNKSFSYRARIFILRQKSVIDHSVCLPYSPVCPGKKINLTKLFVLLLSLYGIDGVCGCYDRISANHKSSIYRKGSIWSSVQDNSYSPIGRTVVMNLYIEIIVHIVLITIESDYYIQ